jgi:hypothetical protein
MPHTIEIREAGPISIVITHFSGHLSQEEFNDWNHSFDRMNTQHDLSIVERLYSIMIVPPGTTTDFGTIVEEMRAAPDDVEFPGTDPDNFRMMFVSQEPMVKLAVQLARRKEFFGGQEVPMFRTLDDALAFVALDRQSVAQDSDPSVRREA